MVPTQDFEQEPHEASYHEHRYAGFWIRFAAALIDTIFLMLVTLPALYFIYGDAYFSSAQSTNLTQGTWDMLINYLVPALVITVFWIYRSATPGKMVLGLKIISDDGSPNLSVRQVIIRYLGYYISTVPLCLGLLWVVFDSRKQGWHDKLAGTLVVYRE